MLGRHRLLLGVIDVTGNDHEVDRLVNGNRDTTLEGLVRRLNKVFL